MNDPDQPAGTTTAVIVATSGRPTIVRELVETLAAQTQPPDHIFVVAAKPDDVSGLNQGSPNLTVSVGRAGSASQRNDGLELAGSRFSQIVFFDDDFVPSRFWIERLTRLFRAQPDISGVTGTVLRDGASTAGIALTEAQDVVAERDAHPSGEEVLHEPVGWGGNTGCNMAFRYSAIRNLRFDERLPGYAWLEDVDFRGQVVRHGRFVRAEALWGVHLGHKAGRSRGVPLGYSQIANSVYLARKGTVPASYLALLAVRNVLSNVVHSVHPEPFIDRRGRLLGNLIALADLVLGRISPERMLGL
jgi:GT2 family glycosyltransferase